MTPPLWYALLLSVALSTAAAGCAVLAVVMCAVWLSSLLTVL